MGRASDRRMERLWDEVVGAGDTALSALSPLVAEPAAGWAGIRALLTGDDPTRSISDVKDALTWEPRTAEGRRNLDAMVSGVDAVMDYQPPFRDQSIGEELESYSDYWNDESIPALQETLGRELGSGVGAGLTGLMGVVGGPARKAKLTRRKGDVYETDVIDLINEKGYSENPLMANIDLENRPETIAKGSWKGKVKGYRDNPLIRDRENDRVKGNRAVAQQDMYAIPSTYEDMLGNPLIPLPADRTGVFDVERIAGRDLKAPVRSLGGPFHADMFGDWRSMAGAAKAKQGHANAVGQTAGTMPVYMYMSMDHPGSNFAHQTSESALRYIEAGGDLTAKGRAALDKKMRSLLDKGDLRGIARNWPGYENPEQMMHWLLDDPSGALDDMPSLGNRRKAFMGALNLKDIQNEGGAIPYDIYSAINEPALRGQPVGYSGFRGMLSRQHDPQQMLYEPGVHKSYDTVIGGDKTFAFDEPMVPYDVMFPDMANAPHRRSKGDAQRMRSVQTSGSRSAGNYQMADEEWLQGIYDWIKSHPIQER